MNQQIEFLSDGGDTVRDVQLYLSPEAEHLLDWFHLTMRLTTMTQSAKGLPDKIGDETTSAASRRSPASARAHEVVSLAWQRLSGSPGADLDPLGPGDGFMGAR